MLVDDEPRREIEFAVWSAENVYYCYRENERYEKAVIDLYLYAI